MAMGKRDYYEILGVSRSSTSEDIKKAFKELARKYHPDVAPGNEELFKEITEAYAVLSDPQKREVYDRYGHEGLKGAGVDVDSFFESGFSFSSIFDDLFDGVFSDFFSTGRRRRRERTYFDKTAFKRGKDIKYNLEVSFKDAAFGAELEIDIPSWEICSSCSGTGSRKGFSRKVCSTCKGTGEYRQVQKTIFGQIVNITTCPSCRGEGEVIPHPCDECSGRGRVKAERKVKVSIPPGVDTGTTLRVPNEGEPGSNDGERGDLYLYISVSEDDFFKREGRDIYCEVPIPFTKAALGGEIEIPTLDGYEKVKVEPGTQHGDSLRLPRKGFPQLYGGNRGDQIIYFLITIPKELTQEQRDLLRRFEEVSGYNTDTKGSHKNNVGGGFFKRFRK